MVNKVILFLLNHIIFRQFHNTAMGNNSKYWKRLRIANNSQKYCSQRCDTTGESDLCKRNNKENLPSTNTNRNRVTLERLLRFISYKIVPKTKITIKRFIKLITFILLCILSEITFILL